jgi:P27 family predicted phage terminase small subunit
MGDRGRTSAEEDRTSALAPAISGPLAPPDDLDELERVQWLAIVNSLPADFFNPSDVSLLAAYCVARAIYVRASRELKAGTLTVPDDKGRPHANPLAAIMTSQASSMAQLAGKLRLCPSSRYSDKSAATKTESGGSGRRPWERSPKRKLRAV